MNPMTQLVELLEHPHAPRYLPELIGRVNRQPVAAQARALVEVQAHVAARGMPQFVPLQSGPPAAPSLVSAVAAHRKIAPPPVVNAPAYGGGPRQSPRPAVA